MQRFPEGGRRWQISKDGGSEPQWRGDGKELYFAALNGSLMAVEITAGDTLEVGVPERLFTLSGRPRPFYRGNYDVTGDGERFLVVRPVDENPPLVVVVNWQALLDGS